MIAKMLKVYVAVRFKISRDWKYLIYSNIHSPVSNAWLTVKVDLPAVVTGWIAGVDTGRIALQVDAVIWIVCRTGNSIEAVRTDEKGVRIDVACSGMPA